MRDVGSTTVMRLVQLLGFDSYTTFKKALAQESLLKNTTPYRSLRQEFSRTSETASRDTFHMAIADGIQVLENLCTPSNISQFEAGKPADAGIRSALYIGNAFQQGQPGAVILNMWQSAFIRISSSSAWRKSLSMTGLQSIRRRRMCF